ncbi:baseplate multidomain protein megatron [Cognatishimia maritima]|uniref:Putative phage tail protein n=1 Tax=Cognatishimia maritima TaxID=870908 RepID=A0A1M5JHB3_9RHOB|nr:glycoside hydrolase/phage tail family protein [Cognatishimia maritima]SHG39898.1 Putative phage tail protein [Cognatishimia maritima]
MTTMVLSAAGAAIGGAVGGSVLGLSSVAIGRFAGGVIGNAIDQRILGGGGRAIETGRIDRYRLSGAAEGRAIPQVYGRMRIAGHVIWATRFKETVTTTGGGKGRPPQPKETTYSYSVSLALGLCEGEITGVTRLWADGREISMADVTMRVYPGRETQLPDPKIEAVEGVGAVPAYRGTAYVVFEDLDLTPFGNRVPQFSFEVSRPAPATQEDAAFDLVRRTEAVALIPGSGEYALSSTPVYYENGPGKSWPANVNSPSGEADFKTAIEVLDNDLPACRATSLVVSWFGNDLRCDACEIRPKIEETDFDGSVPWVVAGVPRSSAQAVPQVEGRPVYGGTPADASVIDAIAHLKATGKAVLYYPFILMDQMEGNGLPDPWTGAEDQPAFPWRGRITCSVAPGLAGVDGMQAAADEVAAFFGTASASDFTVADGAVSYSGPDEWRYRRFILHQAALCQAAGGVDAFCIGSEMRGLTWVRDDQGDFPAVAELIDLLSEVRAILGPDVKLSYAADWSEYFGYQPEVGSDDRLFHLDPLWAQEELDFVGIDNYMPLSDWRDGHDHLDAPYGSIYDLDYLMDNIAGGEGYDWFYPTENARNTQKRAAITDWAYGEAWIYRYKDIRNWWSQAHHDRIGGVRQETPTAWVPQSKPIWFTELGCAAVDKGTNQPNKFLDPKSSESQLPYFSDGQPDEYIQMQYLRAQYRFWSDGANNPTSEVYEGPMVDMSRAFVWAYDTRPFPWFPRNTDLWSDGANFRRGHWISGRSTHRSLASVVREICEASGLTRIDVSGLEGVVRGYVVDEVSTARQSLQPLMLRYGFDAVERDGMLHFLMRGAPSKRALVEEQLAVLPDLDGPLIRTRQSDAETIGRVQVAAVTAYGDYDSLLEDAHFADDESDVVSRTEMALSLQRGEAREVAERWLSEARLAQDRAQFALPLSQMDVQVGDVVTLPSDTGAGEDYRIDRIERAEALRCEAVRVSEESYETRDLDLDEGGLAGFAALSPLTPLFMDLPLLTGDEVPHAPHVMAVADPWPGAAAVYRALTDHDYSLYVLLTQPPVVGILQEALPAGALGVWDRCTEVPVQMIRGHLQSRAAAAVLEGANVAVIGDGTPDNWEVVQFAGAELTGTDEYTLSTLLRGQRGSGVAGAGGWPAGSWLVAWTGAAEQLDMASSEIGLSRSYCVGPASRPVSDPLYAEATHAFRGNGLRPYAPVHLRATVDAAGTLDIRWIRQTRVGGDNWEVAEVPLGEESEDYRLTIWQAGDIVYEILTSSSNVQLEAETQLSVGMAGVVEVRVEQLSTSYGAGPEAVTQVNLG